MYLLELCSRKAERKQHPVRVHTLTHCTVCDYFGKWSYLVK